LDIFQLSYFMDLGKYTLDTLQIYFPWDDDLYTYLKGKGLMSKNPKLKVLPLIYSDNCVSTQGVQQIKRNYVIDPVLYGLHESQLGWQRVGNKDFIIPAERPQLQVIPEDGTIKFKVIPKVNGKNEYHIEFSVMSPFGKIYSNWVAFYLPINSAKELVSKLVYHYKSLYKDEEVIPELNKESKQAQREQMHWAFTKVLSYCFSIAEFDYAVKYLKESGVAGTMPSLVFNANNPKHTQVMKPFIKLGIVETREEAGFWPRNVQLVMKLAQDKIIVGQRGKKIKVKGFIDDSGLTENYVQVAVPNFLKALARLRAWYNAQPYFKVRL
ncbi:MAG: hypothetical protein QXH58_01025, partial [Nitrososphaerales archaeon]